MTRVLAFTPSTQRPILLRHCLLQLQMQSFTCSHAIYINSKPFTDHNDSTNYCPLLTDVKINKHSNVNVAYGKSMHQHFNHIAALQLFNIDDFDLFLKIDDDDIYRKDYVKNVVTDFETNKWDFSATSSTYVINNNKIDFIQKMFFKKIKKNLFNHPLDKGLASTYAFSKKAIKKIIEKGNTHSWNTNYEDPLWLKWMIEDPNIRCNYRESKDYTYFIHTKNYCRPTK